LASPYRSVTAASHARLSCSASFALDAPIEIPPDENGIAELQLFFERASSA
jgi:hypothetical protein